MKQGSFIYSSTSVETTNIIFYYIGLCSFILIN